MSINNITTLTAPSLNGLGSLSLDQLDTIELQTNSFVCDQMKGNMFLIDIVQAENIIVNDALELTNTGYIIIGKDTLTEVQITDDELKYLSHMTSNIQDQIDNINIDISNDLIVINDKLVEHEIEINNNTTAINTNSYNISQANLRTQYISQDTNYNIISQSLKIQSYYSRILFNSLADTKFLIGEDSYDNNKLNIKNYTGSIILECQGPIYLKNNLLFNDLTTQVTAFTETLRNQLLNNTTNLTIQTTRIDTNAYNIALINTNTSYLTKDSNYQIINTKLKIKAPLPQIYFENTTGTIKFLIGEEYSANNNLHLISYYGDLVLQPLFNIKILKPLVFLDDSTQSTAFSLYHISAIDQSTIDISAIKIVNTNQDAIITTHTDSIATHGTYILDLFNITQYITSGAGLTNIATRLNLNSNSECLRLNGNSCYLSGYNGAVRTFALGTYSAGTTITSLSSAGHIYLSPGASSNIYLNKPIIFTDSSIQSTAYTRDIFRKIFGIDNLITGLSAFTNGVTYGPTSYAYNLNTSTTLFNPFIDATTKKWNYGTQDVTFSYRVELTCLGTVIRYFYSRIEILNNIGTIVYTSHKHGNRWTVNHSDNEFLSYDGSADITMYDGYTVVIRTNFYITTTNFSILCDASIKRCT